MSLHEYAFDLKLDVSLRVRASSYEQAVKKLRRKLDCANANFGAWDNGDPILAEASLNYDPPKDALYEFDGDPAEVCPGCGAIEGEPEWGTVGDGFEGYCGNCADKREEHGAELAAKAKGWRLDPDGAFRNEAECLDDGSLASFWYDGDWMTLCGEAAIDYEPAESEKQ